MHNKIIKNLNYNRLNQDVENLIIKKICNILRNKPLTVQHIVYINNRVIIPRVEYKTKIILLSENTCKFLQKPILPILKHAAELPSTTPNIICFHSEFLGEVIILKSKRS